METQMALESNQQSYEELYASGKLFVQYPMDHVIRFHAYYLSQHIRTGRLLDYGCGSGNNAVHYLLNGYDVHGVDVAQASLAQIRALLKMYGLDEKYLEKFRVIPPDTTTLPYDDGFFDVIISNQVLYYLATEDRIRQICRELHRCLRPGGLVFLTVLGARNYYFTHFTRQFHNKGQTSEVVIDDPSHRLYGLREMIYVVRDEAHLKRLFSDFEPVNIGYFDMSLFDMKSGFHWIFVGRKRA